MGKKQGKAKKPKREKVVYYDDNSTVADMSALRRGGNKAPKEPRAPRIVGNTARDKWNTYKMSVLMMIKPMLVVLLILGILYVLMSLALGHW